MTENIRFVSYMYQYQRDQKQGNVGYARVEGRGPQCKVFIHINLPKVEGKLFKAYMFHRRPGKYRFAYLGNILVLGGVGELKVKSDASNVMNSDLTLNDMCGVIIYQERDVFFACEWDEEPVTHSIIDHIENPDLHASFTSDVSVKSNPAEESIERVSAEESIEPISQEELEQTKPFEDDRIDQEPEMMATELAASKEEEQEVAVALECLESEITEKEVESEKEAESLKKVEHEPELQVESLDSGECFDGYYDNRDFYEGQLNSEPQGYQNMGYDQAMQPKNIEVHDLSDPTCPNVDCIEPTYRTCGKVVQQRQSGCMPNQKSQQFECHPIAQNIFRKFQRVYPFEDYEITDCVRIEPQDIGLLPIDTWVLGNNSFLLHGYYTYHHLIFGKIVTPTGLVYIIGVPGVYKNRESFMARMFGFEYFKCCKVKEEKQGEFGYYYMPIQIG